jgi:16S rRNA (guanine527-N7)-methyltransferase
MAIDGGLEAVLEQSRRLGFLGPGSLRVQAEHAAGFAAAVVAPPARLLDLGAGGGVPGLVLAERWPASEVTLLDVAERRCRFLAEAVAALGWAARVAVVRARAEDAGRRPDLRGAFDLVVARGFGQPAVTAECGAPFLAVGGRLVVSEPPAADNSGGPARWPEEGLATLGLRGAGEWRQPYHYRAFEQVSACPERYPRRVGIPAKRPLF